MTGQAHGWEAFLDPGERLLWQGEPARGWHVPNPRAGALGVPILAFGLFCLLMPLPAPRVPMVLDVSLFARIIGTLSTAGGLAVVAYQFLWAPLQLTRTRYALTDRRAFLARRLAGRTLRSGTLPRSDPAELEPTKPPTIRIHAEDQRTGRPAPIRFAFIADADRVMDLMQTRGAR
ncbi:MAG: hypothetical protein AAGB15_07805 [Pseudomonadota bacterium]